MKTVLMLVMSSMFILFSGCATMVAPDKKTIKITSDPIGAHCYVTNEQGAKQTKTIQTPAYVTVNDKEYYQNVVCDNGKTIPLEDSVHGATYVNLWTWIFPILMWIDYGTGNMFEYEDTHVISMEDNNSTIVETELEIKE